MTDAGWWRHPGDAPTTRAGRPGTRAFAGVAATATAARTAGPEPAPTVTETRTVEVTTTVTARSASGGDTPLYAGDPGYDSHLDRDGDGVACE